MSAHPVLARAAVLYRTGEPLVVESGIELPVLGRGQVRVRVAYAGLCHSQLMEVRGRRGPDPWLPHLLGHEATGRVEAVGEGVAKVAPGQRVVLGWIRGAGIEAGGCQYRKGDVLINSGAVTAFGTRVVVSENRCTPLPDGVPDDVGVLFGCALPTGAGMVLNTLQPEAGTTLVVLGLGGIGMSAMLAALTIPGVTVIAVDVEAHKLALARELGAHSVLDAATQDVRAQVRALSDGGAHYCVEAVGTVDSIELGFELVRRGGGRLLFASHPQAGSTIRIDPYELICGKRIEGSWGGASAPDQDVPRFADWYRSGHMPLERLLDGRYPLDRINEALDDLEARRIVRALVDMQGAHDA
ncbi:MAG: zinc-binding dehydrogenase [Rhodocyclales bacterium]|nr:zinc-binding dehydrogenase [Rhodocyclales bacterium]